MLRLIGLTLILMLLIGLSAQLAVADGFTFASTAFSSCWEDTEGFDANLQPKPIPSPTPAGTHFAQLTMKTDTGQVVLNLDGTVTSTFTTTNLHDVGVGNNQFSISHSTCPGTWTFDPATQTLHTQYTCTFTSTTGSTGTVPGQGGIYRLAGTTLVGIGQDPPRIDVIHVDQNGASAAFDIQRICNHSGAMYFVK
jgi:hypothetical protein